MKSRDLALAFGAIVWSALMVATGYGLRAWLTPVEVRVERVYGASVSWPLLNEAWAIVESHALADLLGSVAPVQGQDMVDTFDADGRVLAADLVIGGVLIPGAAAPKLITAEMVRQMKAGAVLVDVAIDQGGCAETSRATTHAEPTYVVDEVVHYCVANMPGAVARTSTLALNNATLPFVIALAQKGTRRALEEDAHLLAGLNVAKGVITCGSVAEAHGLPFQSAAGVLEHL